MSSVIIQGVVDSIATLCADLDGVKVIPYMTNDISKLPALVIEMPDILRGLNGDPESQLGSYDWRMDFDVTIWVDLTNLQNAQAQLIDLVEQFIALVDDNHTLSGEVDEARVTSAEINYLALSPRKTIMGYRCAVSVLKLVAD